MANIGTNVPFTIKITYDRHDAAGFRLLINGEGIEENPAQLEGELPQTVYFHVVNGLPAGTHTIKVEAYNENGNGASAELILIAAGNVPAGQITIQIVVLSAPPQ